ncbi:MAG: hypothetical protein ACOC2W_00305 [bacterium]
MEDRIQNFLKELFYEDWMSDNNWEEFKKDLFKELNIEESYIDRMIKIGEENGISLQHQMYIIKQQLLLKRSNL